MPTNNIYIIGAGAIGKVLALLLKLQGKNVTIIRGSVDDQASHEEIITVELSDKNTLEASVEFSTLSHFDTPWKA